MEQEPTVAQSSKNNIILYLVLAVIISALVTGGIVYAVQSKQNADTKNTLQAQIDVLTSQVAQLPTTTPVATTTPTPSPSATPDVTASWKTYTSTSQGISFKYPSDWFVTEEATYERISLANYQGVYDKSNRPASAENFWISYGASETAQTDEDLTKSGKPSCCSISGTVTSGTISSGSLTINSYAYTTVGGSALEAYWHNPAGKRFSAMNATEVGTSAQAGEVDILTKLLATISFN